MISDLARRYFSFMIALRFSGMDSCKEDSSYSPFSRFQVITGFLVEKPEFSGVLTMSKNVRF